jgi:hypothetical protein
MPEKIAKTKVIKLKNTHIKNLKIKILKPKPFVSEKMTLKDVEFNRVKS